MKRLLLLLLLISGMTNAQNLIIPDANFKAKLLEASPANQIAYGNGGYMKIDANNDGEIQLVEAQVIDSLNVHNVEILSVAGVSGFSNLKKLDFSSCRVSTFDASGLTQLKILLCSDNEMSTITLSGLSNLEFFDCSWNSFESLDLSGLNNLKYLRMQGVQNLQNLTVSNLPNLITLNCDHSWNCTNISLQNLPALKNLTCRYTLITTLDLSGVPNLEYLDCEGNNLTSLDLSQVANLKTLSVYNCNFLTALDFSQNHAIEHIMTVFCPITSLNLSGTTALVDLDVSTNLITVLDCSESTNLESITIADCPNLQQLFIKNGKFQYIQFGGNSPTNVTYICGDESEVMSYSNEMIEVNSYCTTSSAGNSNNISGNVLYDVNNSGCEVTEGVNFVKVKITDGVNEGAYFTGVDGNYNITVGQGTFTLTPQIENPELFTVNPASAIISFAEANSSTTLQDFCVTALGNSPDVGMHLGLLEPARPGFDAKYVLIYENKGNQVLSGTVSFTYDDAVLDLIESNPNADAQTTGSLTYNYTNLQPFESKAIIVTLNVNGPMETPAVNIDDILNISATATITGMEDILPEDNTTSLQQIVVGSFDPNDKYCNEGTVVSPTEIGKYLSYTINFENTGTASAENVVIRDRIDIEKFDVASLQMLSSSHPVQAKVTGNRVEFFFNGIDLEAAEHGYVIFKIKTLATIHENESVTNQADIFFDYNFPVATEPAVTTFSVLGTEKFSIDNSVNIYPNPAGDLANIRSRELIRSIELFDAQGRIVYTSIVESNESKINLNSFSNGVYYLRVHTDSGIKSQKLIKK